MEQRSNFIQSISIVSDGISKNLTNASLDTSDSQKVEEALIGAYLYSKDLNSLYYRLPRWTVLGVERNFFTDTMAFPERAFSYVADKLEEILDEYQKTRVLSPSSQSTIERIADAFSVFHDNLEKQTYISQGSFANYIDTLCSTIYP